ncbi:MAG: 50S ribosomal protein L18 [Candidatus Lokiarchaeota archaeon]|jgi:large subunit ribosomal protein L18|nr:50S ribosomal protein L18 [Candidatus Lokiarchaeota archaeon]
MAKGPRYRRPFRRRAEGKTNYHRRMKLLKSKKLRAVIRVSNNHIIVQIIQSKIGGDKIIVSAHSKELVSKFGWNANTGNVPAAYLTGFLAGIRAKKQNVEEAILDLGIFYHRNRVLAAFKGILQSGLKIPYNENFFPENIEEIIKGSHIEQYASLLKSENPEKYEQVFSGYLKKNNINPQKISQMVTNTFKKIESSI